VEAAPEFVETEADYPTLLEETEWAILDRRDFTAAFARSCAAKLRLEQEERHGLLPIVGAAELDRRGKLLSRRITALERGILKRELFLATPADSGV
jgi:hypothetical protein